MNEIRKIVLMEQQSIIKGRERATTFLFITFSVLLGCTLVIIFFQGFGAWGFKLESGFLHWLGGATIGEIGALAAFVYGFFFRPVRSGWPRAREILKKKRKRKNHKEKKE